MEKYNILCSVCQGPLVLDMVRVSKVLNVFEIDWRIAPRFFGEYAYIVDETNTNYASVDDITSPADTHLLYVHALCFDELLTPLGVDGAQEIRHLAGCRQRMLQQSDVLRKLSAAFAMKDGVLDYSLLLSARVLTKDLRWSSPLYGFLLFAKERQSQLARVPEAFGDAIATCFTGSIKADVQARTQTTTTKYQAYAPWWGSGLPWLAAQYNNLCVLPVDPNWGTHILWHCSEDDYGGRERKIEVAPNLKANILSCRADPTVDFVGLNLLLVGNTDGCNENDDLTKAHANTILIDVRSSTGRPSAEHFEPNGPVVFESEWFDSEDLHDMLNEWFDVLGIDYIPPEKACRVGFQVLQSEYGERREGDPGGFCQAWSLWYMNLRVANPKLTRDEAIQSALHKMRKEPLHEFIRNYAQWMHNEYVRISTRLSTGLVLRKRKFDFERTIAQINSEIEVLNKKRSVSYQESMQPHMNKFKAAFATCAKLAQGAGLDNTAVMNLVRNLMDLYVGTTFGHHVSAHVSIELAKSLQTRSALPQLHRVMFYFEMPHTVLIYNLGYNREKKVFLDEKQDIGAVVLALSDLLREYHINGVLVETTAHDSMFNLNNDDYTTYWNYRTLRPYKQLDDFLKLPHSRLSQRLCHDWVALAETLSQGLRQHMHFRLPLDTLTTRGGVDARPAIAYFQWYVAVMQEFLTRYKSVKTRCAA